MYGESGLEYREILAFTEYPWSKETLALIDLAAAKAYRIYEHDNLSGVVAKTGQIVWSSSPGDRPRDNSFSHPYLTWIDGRRLLINATGDGSVVGVNARTGDALWRIPLFKAGINATVLAHNNDKVIAIYGTPYEPGQMVALKIPKVVPTNYAAGPIVIERPQAELWSADVCTSTSSPILVGDRGVPVLVVGRINHPQLAEDILWHGHADMIVLGRALLADPDFPNKAAAGRFDDIAPCPECNIGCLSGDGRPSCVINPDLGREKQMALSPGAKPKRVSVAGGGPAGLEAARRRRPTRPYGDAL